MHSMTEMPNQVAESSLAQHVCIFDISNSYFFRMWETHVFWNSLIYETDDIFRVGFFPALMKCILKFYLKKTYLTPSNVN